MLKVVNIPGSEFTLDLCEKGAQFERAWDLAVQELKRHPVSSDGSHVTTVWQTAAYRAAQLYFFHRTECMECQVVLPVEAQNAG